MSYIRELTASVGGNTIDFLKVDVLGSDVTHEAKFVHWVMCISQIDGLMQERRNSSALAMELRLSCTNPSNYF